METELVANKILATKEYWNTRYQKEDDEYFEWFKTWEDLKPYVSNIIDPSHNILHLGCGNSRLSQLMYKDGYLNQCNIDYSDIVIEQMKELHKSLPMIQWICMDATQMRFESESFDIVIDKGTMDALLTAQEDPWELEEPLKSQIDRYCSETSRFLIFCVLCNNSANACMGRVLKTGGKYIYITFGQPHFRKPILMKKRYQWSMEMIRLGDFFHYYIYILTKHVGELDSDEWEKPAPTEWSFQPASNLEADDPSDILGIFID